MSAVCGLHIPPPGRVYRCAWCRADAGVSDGLPYFSYIQDSGTVYAVPGDATNWSGSDGICPAHHAMMRAPRALLSYA
jgi:hypothetical protein